MICLRPYTYQPAKRYSNSSGIRTQVFYQRLSVTAILLPRLSPTGGFTCQVRSALEAAIGLSAGQIITDTG